MNIDLITPIKYVVDNSQEVKINYLAVEEFCKKFKLTNIRVNESVWPFKPLVFKSLDDELDYWFLCDSQAFCFWGYTHKWTISYQGMKMDGWWALMASMQRVLDNQLPIFEGKYLANLTNSQAVEIFAGQPEIPLIQERIEILRKIGKQYIKSGIKFSEWLRIAPQDAVSLMLQIVELFPGFDDKANYNGKKIYFYKKAQLLVADINHLYKKWHKPEIKGISRLIGEADYKIPALLRDLGLLIYTDKLASRIDHREELKPGSGEEVEIRANMLWIIQLMLDHLRSKYPQLTASELDRILWFMSQDKSLIIHPYHLTKTVNY
jgi:hypothetical protein